MGHFTCRYPILPRPKEITIFDGQFLLLAQTALVPLGGQSACKEAKFLAGLIADGTGIRCHVKADTKRSRIELCLGKRLAGVKNTEEGYAIHVTPDAATLTAKTDRGLFYACQSLFDLVKSDLTIPCCRIIDWPNFKYRGFMADPARKFFSLERLKWDIDQLARSKYNSFHLHFTDSESFTLPSKKWPKLNTRISKPHGVYTRTEVRELCAYAATRHIQIIPEIEMPGHATLMIDAYPELKCCVPSGRPSRWAFCIGAESTYRFLDKLLGEIALLFPGELFHIGSDELEFQDRIESIFISWRECKYCRSRMRKEGLSNYRDLFYYFLHRVHDILEKHGKRMIMWNDNIDIAKPHAVPRDILQQFWRIAGKGRGPKRGCSLSKFVRDGFKVVNSFYPETYLDLYVRDEKLVKWHPRKNPQVPEGFRENIIGGECCAWSDGGKGPYQRTLPSAWTLFADRLWNQEPVRDVDGFAESIPRHIFGPRTPAEMQPLFRTLGAIVLCGNTHYQVTPEAITVTRTAQRLHSSRQLLRLLTTERRSRRLMNLSLLKEYTSSLKALEKELAP